MLKTARAGEEKPQELRRRLVTALLVSPAQRLVVQPAAALTDALRRAYAAGDNVRLPPPARPLSPSHASAPAEHRACGNHSAHAGAGAAASTALLAVQNAFCARLIYISVADRMSLPCAHRGWIACVLLAWLAGGGARAHLARHSASGRMALTRAGRSS